MFFTAIATFFVSLITLDFSGVNFKNSDNGNCSKNVVLDTNILVSGKENENSENVASDTKEVVNNGETDHKIVKVETSIPSLNTTTDSKYKDIYPNLCTQRPEKQVVLEKTVYLTFDDGPSERTLEILDILKKYGIKATFFVIGNTSKLAKECMKQIVAEGHTIAMHTYTHDFKKIYNSVESYLEDINKVYNLIYETTGVKPSIFRFAGGSRNGFNKSNYREIIAEMYRRGFDYFDWNLSSGDAARKGLVPASECVNNVLKHSEKYNSAVVLMHDAKPKITTVEALPKIIEGLKAQGFSFERLSNEISPVSFSLVKPYV